MPIFEVSFEGVVVLELGTVRADSGSDSVAVSFDGSENFLGIFAGCSGLGGKDFWFVTG
jgi:hypothetical protein